jgi:LemA protein
MYFMNYQFIIYSLIGVLVLWFIWTYNVLVRFRFRVKEALSDIDVQLKRRFDLVPNLVEAVKGYMAHEKSLLEKVTQARSQVAGGGNPLERAQAENQLSATLKTLFAVAENYPDLKVNTNFLELQRELADTENKIQAARRFYNSSVLELNAKIDGFPSGLVASLLGFRHEKFFEISNESEREPVKVKF